MQILHSKLCKCNFCIANYANADFADVCTMYMSNSNTPSVYEFDYEFEFDYVFVYEFDYSSI